MVKVYAPNREYKGVSAGVTFNKGVADTDDPAALAYFRSAGYGIGEYVPPPAPAAPPDTRDTPLVVSQPPSRDAAVERNAAGPWSDAFLPPVNAGEADPHGPQVASPGLHAVPPAPIVPGPVESNLAAQETDETRVAAAVLVDRRDVGDATLAGIDLADRGPLGLSDPASVSEGPDAAVEGGSADATSRSTTPEAPAKSASKPAWVDHAVASGMSREDAEALKKGELVERFGS